MRRASAFMVVMLLMAASEIGTTTGQTRPSVTTESTNTTSEVTPTSAAVTLPQLTETYGCGYGFYLGNDEQTTALLISFRRVPPENLVEVPVESQLSDEIWEAELIFGTDLFANWCDDVIEAHEPEPVIEETWAVSGMIRVLDLPEYPGCGPVVARLIDVEAVSTNGRVATLGGFDVTNMAWGCGAG